MIALAPVLSFGAMVAALPQLNGVYVFCLIVGGALLLISTVFGGHHDVGGDVDLGGHFEIGGDVDVHGALEVDPGVDADVELGGAGDHLDVGDAAHHDSALALSNWLSVRFVVYFAAMFGLVGTVFTYMTDVSPVATLVVALIAGIAMGQLVHQMIRALQRSSVTSEINAEDFAGKTARVTITVRPPARGEVGVRMGNREVFVPAVAQRGDDTFETGSQVVITSYSGGTAEVVSRKEYEFTHNA